MMLLCVGAAMAFSPVVNQPAMAGSARSSAVTMGGTKKLWGFADDGLFEGREVSFAKPPVNLLSRLNEIEASTYIAEAGLLSKAEELGVFSKLESLGAFSTAEALLPTIEKLRLLSTFEALVNVEAGLLFTFANFLIVFAPTLFVLQICGFVPMPDGPAVLLELGVDAASLAAGAALFATAFLISKLQVSDQ
jgi:hypothetical protein